MQDGEYNTTIYNYKWKMENVIYDAFCFKVPYLGNTIHYVPEYNHSIEETQYIMFRSITTVSMCILFQNSYTVFVYIFCSPSNTVFMCILTIISISK